MNPTPHAPPGPRLRAAARRMLRDDAGFSLMELLIVLVILGILAFLAVPRLIGVTTRAKMTEAKLQLRALHTFQQAYFLETDTYAGDLAEIGFEAPALRDEGGSALYRYAVEQADARSYTATATATVDFDRDGTLNVWEVREDGRIHQRIPD